MQFTLIKCVHLKSSHIKMMIIHYLRIQLLSKLKPEKQKFKSMFESITYLNTHLHDCHVIKIASIHLKIHFLLFLGI